jgi:lipopolysaccharide export system permease protein
VSNVTFQQLAGGNTFSSTGQLIAGLRNPSLDIGADVRVTIHSRMVQPLLDVTLLFLGLPLVLRRDSRNVFIAIGMCAGVVMVFMVVTMICHHLGQSYWIRAALGGPALAAWLPLMIFVPVAVLLTESARQ